MPRYRARYCEENIWMLLHEQLDGVEQAWAVFVSNANRTCAMWGQSAAPSSGQPVVWDYHVVALERFDQRYRIWDLDSILDAPSPVEQWCSATFPLGDSVPPSLSPRFRVIERDDYLSYFSSDRSHMRDDDGNWLAPPPDWAPVFDADRGMNLPVLVDVSAPDDEGPGEVLDAAAFRARFDGQQE